MWRMLVCVAVGVALVTGGTAVAQQDKDMHGKIVKVNPDKNTVTIKVGEGKEAKEVDYKVAATTKFWKCTRGSDGPLMCASCRSI